MRGQGSGPRFFSPVLSITHKKAKKKSCRNTRLLRIDNGTQKPMMLKTRCESRSFGRLPGEERVWKTRRLSPIFSAARSTTGRASGPRYFFKGCPLHCIWCHNPECIRFEPETLCYPEKCIGCAMCGSGCYSGPRMMCGKAMTAGEVPEQILSDKPYPWDGFYGQMGAAFFRREKRIAFPPLVCYDNKKRKWSVQLFRPSPYTKGS